MGQQLTFSTVPAGAVPCGHRLRERVASVIEMDDLLEALRITICR
jgi:hypothetical protein